MDKPLVSVVVPAYNCGPYVEGAVRSALEQTVGNLEIIAIDDASTDNTPALLEALSREDGRVRFLRNEGNQGVVETRNRGFREAKGRYIALLDGDDQWLPEKLEQQLPLLDRGECDLCYTGYSFLDREGRPLGRPYPVPDRVDFRELLRENVIGCSTVVCRGELLRKYPMRPGFAHEDYVLWLELLREGYRARGVPQPLMRYRILEESRSGNKGKAARNRWRVYRDFLGMPLPAAGWAFVRYAARGIRKHWRPS